MQLMCAAIGAPAVLAAHVRPAPAPSANLNEPWARLAVPFAVHLAQAASANPGPAFPFYDNCRRNASFSRWSLRMLQ